MRRSLVLGPLAAGALAVTGAASAGARQVPLNLGLTSICWQEGVVGGTHVMRVRNQTTAPVPFTWEVVGGATSGSGTAPAGTDTFLEVASGGTFVLRWTDNGLPAQTTKAINTTPCQGVVQIGKTVQGATAPPPATPYVVEVRRAGTPTQAVSLLAGETVEVTVPGRVALGSFAVGGIPAAATYEIVETSNAGAESTSIVPASVTIGSGGYRVVAITNTFPEQATTTTSTTTTPTTTTSTTTTVEVPVTTGGGQDTTVPTAPPPTVSPGTPAPSVATSTAGRLPATGSAAAPLALAGAALVAAGVVVGAARRRPPARLGPEP